MKLPLLAMVAALFLGGCSNTWEGVKDDSSEIYNESKETVHEATEQLAQRYLIVNKLTFDAG